MPLSLGMNKDKTSMSVWLTQEEKDIWKQLARLNNMNLSAYTHFVIKEVIKESLNLPELKVSLDVERESSEEDKSELEAIRKLATVRGQTRQALIVSAVRELLLNKSQIDPKQYQLISDSTLSLNRIGVNLNQIARVLNEQNKSGELNPSDIAAIPAVLKQLDQKIGLHIKEIDEFLLQHKDRLKIRSAVKKTEKENEKRAELAGRRDVAIFIEAKDVLDAIEQLSKPRLFSDSRLVESLRWQYSECETRKQFLRKVLTEQFKFVGSNANCPEPQNTDAQVERRRARETR